MSDAADVRHRIVVLSVLLMSAASATMLLVQFEASAMTATLAGAAVFAILFLVYDQSRKSAEIDRLSTELARAGAPGAASGSMASDSAPDLAPVAAELAAKPAPRRRVGAPDVKVADAISPDNSRIDAQPPKPDKLQEGQLRPAASMAATLPSAAMAPPSPVLPPIPAEPLRDQWAFRPREPVMASAGAASTVETDLALVQRKIKALADEVNAAEEPSAAALTASFEYRPTSQQAALESSIDALKAAGGAMRDRRKSPETALSASQSPFAEFSIPATAERIAASPPAAPTASAQSSAAAAQTPGVPDVIDPQLLAEIADGVERGLIDVFLSPIVTLATQDIAHYETRIRLVGRDGGYCDDACSHIASTDSDAGGDVLAKFDAARLSRASVLARRLAERGKTGSLLASVFGRSLSSEAYLETFASVFQERNAISEQLTPTFAQAELQRFTQTEWDALRDMNAFGFRFALDDVRHLDVDFDDLARRGFAFVKIDGKALLSGAPYRDGIADAAETQRRVAEAQMTLIAGQISDEIARMRLAELGVALGQGDVFGAARRIAIDLPGARSEAA